MFPAKVSRHFHSKTSCTDKQRWHKQYASIGKDSVAALQKYKEEVQGKTFPAAENVSDNSFLIPRDNANDLCL